MNPIQSDILFKLFQQVNERIWYYETETDRICYVASDGSTEEAIPFDEHMAMKHPDDCPQVYESMEYMVKHRCPYPQPLMIRYRDKRQPDGYRYTMNSIVPVFEGNVIHVVGTEQDITPMVRKQQLAEQQTQIVGELLRRRNEDTWNVDCKTSTIHIQRPGEEGLSMTLDELLNSFDLSESDDAIASVESMRRGEAKLIEFHVKEKTPRSDGLRHHIKCTAMPSKYDYHGNVTEYVGVGTDITKELADQRKLKHALAQAKEQSHKKSVFVARASHDLRNPLNTLLNLADMLSMDISKDERKEICDMMKQSGESLLALVNDILDLTRIENGLQFTQEEFEIQPLIETVILSFEISSKKSHNITLCATDVQKTTIKSDSKRLAQIVSNYLSNAIKFSPQGSDVRVTLRSNNEGVYIAVTDQGCGIAAEDQGRVFDEFARFNTEVTGTGLGLSICKHIAEGLGGTVGFESEQGVGSTFWVKI